MVRILLAIILSCIPALIVAAENPISTHVDDSSIITDHHPLPDPFEWVPTLNFDGAADSFCYPDEPSVENNNECKAFNPDAPVFWEGQFCSSKLYKLAYWFWYGLQKKCPVLGIKDWDRVGLPSSTHDNDWEHIVLNFEIDNENRFHLQSVTYFQHAGHYSREKTIGPVKVWVGKIGHGSYHNRCDGKGVPYLDTEYCDGGCGYWEDFRNDTSGVHWTPTNLQPLEAVKNIHGPIGDRIRDEDYCSKGACRGAAKRAAPLAGCWQNNAVVHRSSAEKSTFDAPLFFECSGARLSSSLVNASALTQIHSYHDNRREDREWTFGCSSLHGAPAKCEWTDAINDWDKPINYTAPQNAFIAGLESVHDNYREDRIWKVKSCEQQDKCRTACSWTDYLNKWDGELSLSTGNKIIAGIKSEHDNKREDRRWNFLVCDLEICPPETGSSGY